MSETESTRLSSLSVRQRRIRPAWPWYLAFAVVAGVVGAIISAIFLSESLAALGIPDPGILTTAGLPFIRSAAVMVAALAVGSFYFSSFLTPPRLHGAEAERRYARRKAQFAAWKEQSSTTNKRPFTVSDLGTRLSAAPLDVDGSIAARTGAWASVIVCALSLLLVPLYLSDVSGQSLAQALQPANFMVAITQVSTSLAWLAVACIAALTAIVGLTTKTWIIQPILLLLSLGMLVPLGLEGHSAAGGDHDWGTNSYLWHLFFMALWVGGLMALIAHILRRGTWANVAVRRYSTLALVSIIVMAISGVINAALRMDFSDWFSSGYGLLMCAKTVGVIVLGIFGWIHRAKTIPVLNAHVDAHGVLDSVGARAFKRVAIAEVMVMGAVVGVAISLSRTPPPPPRNTNLTVMDVELGYTLSVAPTFWNWWMQWRLDIIFGVLAVIMAALYVWGVRRVRAASKSWSSVRTAWFIAGCVALFATTSSGIGMAMPAMFSVHMVGHMALSMVVPVFWVLGAPLTLWLEATHPAEDPRVPGMHEYVEVALSNPLLNVLTHPAVSVLQFITIFYLLYFMPDFYALAISEHAGHLIMNVLFLWSGFMYFWEVHGIDPLPIERSPMSKAAWLTFSLPFHMFFAVYLMSARVVMGEAFYSSLGLPWDVDLRWDQTVGGGIAWASGQFPLIIVYGSVLMNWLRADKKDAERYDAHADATDDEELEAYNEMLAAMQRRNH